MKRVGQMRVASSVLLASFMFASFTSCLPSRAGTLAVTHEWAVLFSKTQEAQAPVKRTEDMKALGNHDVVLLLDRSGSMETLDCEASVAMQPQALASGTRESRWQWCCDQTRSLTAQTGDVLKNGIRVVVFSTLQKVYENVGLKGVFDIFQANPPKGSTNVTIAVKRQVDDYFRRKSHPEAGPVKPLLIAVVTDGCFENLTPLQRVITDATKKMTSSDEITVVFLQVGQDEDATRILKKLSRGEGSVASHADFDIVSAKPFSELKKEGLTDALLQVVAADVPHTLVRREHSI